MSWGQAMRLSDTVVLGPGECKVLLAIRQPSCFLLATAILIEIATHSSVSSLNCA